MNQKFMIRVVLLIASLSTAIFQAAQGQGTVSQQHRFSIQFDYRFAGDYFKDPTTRRAMQAAADAWSNIITSDFDSLPTASVIRVKHPLTNQVHEITLEQPIDDLLVFVFAYGLNANTKASAGPFFGPVSEAKAIISKGNQYVRFDIGKDEADSGYPRPVSDRTWPGVPFASFDAVTNWGNGKAYIFKGNQYVRFDIKNGEADSGYPRPINDKNWPGVPFTSFDAVTNWGNGKAYIFKGNQYVRFDIERDEADSGYPKPINNANWKGVPFTSFDAVYNQGDGNAFIFKGNQYVRFDIGKDEADSGYPKPISNANWAGVQFGGVDAVSVFSDDAFDLKKRYNSKPFQPWVGTLKFNTNGERPWFVDSTPDTADDIPSAGPHSWLPGFELRKNGKL
jgi:matrix metalloproteinase-14 (membrane-inserted)